MNPAIHESGKSDVLISDEEAFTVIACGKVLGISKVSELYLSLRESLKSSLYIKIDASCVERVDTAGLQLLCAFVSESIQSGKKIQWHRPTQELIYSAKLLQIHTRLALAGSESESTE
jgi:ABC-type transporter Mla MlaB component